MREGRIFTPAGTEVVYRLDGEGDASRPAMVLTNGLTTDTAFWRYLLPRFARDHRVLTWDLPGHGRSGPARGERDATIEGQPSIICQLMDEVEMERAIQVGWSTGSQAMFELYRYAPGRCVALISLLGSAGHVLDTAKLPLPGGAIDFIARNAPRPLFDAAAQAVARISDNRLGHLLGRRLGLLGADTSARDVSAITGHMRQLDLATVQTMVHSAQVQSAHDLLPRIEVPLLIVSGDVDPFAPAEQVGQPMYEKAPGSELVRLPQGTHTALLDHADVIGDAIESFLSRRCAQ